MVGGVSDWSRGSLPCARHCVSHALLLCVPRCYTVFHGGAAAQGGLSGDNTLHLFLNRRHGGKWDVGLVEQGRHQPTLDSAAAVL